MSFERVCQLHRYRCLDAFRIAFAQERSFVVRLAFLPLLTALFLESIRAQEATNSPTIPSLPDANAEMVAIVAHDQWDRGTDMFGKGSAKPSANEDWLEISKRDKARRGAVSKLLSEGQLKTSKDHYFAALVFQHGDNPPDFLLAHTLATTAAFMGEKRATWLAAASLDRYLKSLKQPQVFGTQFYRVDGSWTMEPYDRSTISDSIRSMWCVIPLADQERRISDTKEGKPMRANTFDPRCR